MTHMFVPESGQKVAEIGCLSGTSTVWFISRTVYIGDIHHAAERQVSEKGTPTESCGLPMLRIDECPRPVEIVGSRG